MDEDFLKQPENNYYLLDLSKPYFVEGWDGKLSVRAAIIVQCVILALILFFTLLSIKALLTMPILFIIPAIMFFLVLAIFICTLISAKKSKAARAEDEKLLKNCYLTEGKITFYECVAKTVRDVDSSTTRFDITLKYQFNDLNGDERTETYIKTYSCDPEFYKGQYLMVAFDNYKSLILNKFTLLDDGEEKLLKSERMRGEDDFDGLTGEIVCVDKSIPIKPYYRENYIFWLPFAVTFTLMWIIYIAVNSVLVVPEFLKAAQTNPVSTAFTVIVIYLFSLPMLLVGVIFSVKILKRGKVYKKIISGEHYFTYCNVFASEKTYRKGGGKSVVYCYIDKWGEKRRAKTDCIRLRKTLNTSSRRFIAVYNAQGLSELIFK